MLYLIVTIWVWLIPALIAGGAAGYLLTQPDGSRGGWLPGWLGWVGVLGGSLLSVGGILAVGGLGASGTFHDLAGALSSIPIPIVWVWMIGTSVVLFRATPKRV